VVKVAKAAQDAETVKVAEASQGEFHRYRM
jgi:hypothetical protein